MKINLSKEALLLKEGEHLHVVVSQEQTLRLRNDVAAKLNKDMRLNLTVRKLCKTEQTFDRSLGSLYDFLNDHALCGLCKHQVLTCPKGKYRGYQLALEYDEASDSIQSHWITCPLFAKVQKDLSRIKPCDYGYKKLYADAISLVECITKGDNAKKMKDVTYVISKAQKDAKIGSLERGFALYPIHDAALVSSALHAIALFYATNGKKVSYIEAKSFFTNLSSYRTDIKEATARDCRRAQHADVLIFENLDEIPFLSQDTVKKYVLPLLEAREQSGRVTFCSLTNQEKLKRLICGNEIADKDSINKRFASLMEPIAISDLDLR